ncbi:MAG: anthranilate synthase component I [Gammaproteobacteria bacterium CG22_combo_CG10-13_8_21_14_all_40_8]|nr:MAG: anthranilate synthase component I [Gammaproteobacteria bacterium CG22_combo_CG10-13_8_21_14_all_40_8]
MKPIPLRFLTQSFDTVVGPQMLFSHLTDNGHQVNSLLLESGEPGANGCDKSILITESALVISGFGLKLILEAKTANGRAILKNFHCQTATVVEKTENRLELHCQGPSRAMEHQERLLDKNLFSPLRELMQCLKPHDQPSAYATQLAGAFGYELIDAFENLPAHQKESNTVPDLYLLLPESRIIYDHQHHLQRIEQLVVFEKEDETRYHHATQKIRHLCIEICNIESKNNEQSTESNNPTHRNDPATEELSVNLSDDEFIQIVLQCKDYIKQGEVFQIVPSRYFNLSCPEPLNAYKQLSKTNPSPYQFYLCGEQFTLFGASPESAVKFSAKNRIVDLYPIAGTVKRGRDLMGKINQDEDNRLECALRLDKKEQAEHMMLVDLARNDIARLSKTGTRYVSQLLQVDRYSHVMHLVSRVEGILEDEFDALHAYQACCNMGTLTGAPKLRASELIRQLESTKRSFYGGAIGYLDALGNLDTAIVIRSALVENSVAKITAGAGVVADSDPLSEANETRQKAMAVISAISQTQIESSSEHMHAAS